MTSTHTLPLDARLVALLAATLLASSLVGCQGRLSFSSRGASGLSADPDAGATDAGRIVLMRDPDAGTSAGDAASPPDAGARADAASPPPSCAPSCAGRACGPDGCGGSCGACAAGASCSPAFQCEAPPPPPPGGGTHAVTLYGASWCGACRAARAFLELNDVAFVEHDVEDPSVQSEMLSRAAMLGYSLGGSVSLPVLVIDTTMTEGWSESRARTQLGL